MHTLRAELRLASDAAARAGTEELRATQSPERAIAKTIEIAAMNSVGGNPIKLTSQDIQLGQTQYQDDGTWKFVPGLTPYQALRVNVRFGDGAPNPSVPLFFGRFWESNRWPRIANQSHLTMTKTSYCASTARIRCASTFPAGTGSILAKRDLAEAEILTS